MLLTGRQVICRQRYLIVKELNVRYASLPIACLAICQLLFIAKVSAATVLSGPVTSLLSSTEFSLDAGIPHGHVPVHYSQSIVEPMNTRIQVGQNLSTTGSFNANGSFSATRVTVGSQISSTPHYHIAIWAYDNYWGQGESASASNVNLLVSYAQGNGKSVNDCHTGSHSCKAVAYVDPNHVYNGSPAACVMHPDADMLAGASESWFIHIPGYSNSTHRVHGKSAGGCMIWEMNPNSIGVQAWWRAFLRTHADSYDLYLLDNDPMDIPDAGYFPSGGGCNPWPRICTSTHEILTNPAEAAARSNFVDAMSHSNGSPMYFFYQQASFNDLLDLSALALTRRFVGLTCEGCISTYAAPARTNLYASVLDEMAAVDGSTGSFMLISHGNAPTGSALQVLQRLVTTGIIWLGYSEGHTVVQPDLESNTTRLAVWPEDLIYPSGPLENMRFGARDLLVATGVYRREFATCYQRGAAIGPCAAIVNANGHAVTIPSVWFRQAYGHIVTLSGGDVLSGGSAQIASLRFIPSSTRVQPSGALLLTR